MKRLLTVTMFTGVLTLLKMLAGFVIAKVVAINTGPTGMAMLGQVQSMVSTLNGLAASPTSSGLVRYTAQYKNRGYAFCCPWWRASLYWVSILLIFVIPLGIYFSRSISIWLFGDLEYQWLIWVTLSLLPLSAVGSIINSVINGQQLYRRYISLGMLSVFITSSLMIFMIEKGHLTGALLAASMQTGLIGAVLVLSSLREPWFKLKYWLGRTGPKHRRALGGYLLMALTSALTIPVSLLMIRKILVYNLGWELAGQWQAVWRVSEVYLSVITLALSTYYLPRLSGMSNSSEIKNEINRTMLVVVPIISLIAICIYLLRDIAISILFTEQFRAARDLFFIQLCGDVLKIVCWLLAYPMLSKGMVKIFVSTEILFALLFVFLGYILVGRYGVDGANLGYLITYFLYFILCVFYIRKKY